MTIPYHTTSTKNHLSRTYPKQAAPKVSTAPVIRMIQHGAEWFVTINGGQELTATLAEVALHQRIVELEAELKAIKTRLRGS